MPERTGPNACPYNSTCTEDMGQRGFEARWQGACMEIWVALVGGLIVGWVAEWVIDWLYWRRGVEAFYATEAELRRQVASLAAENESLRQQLASRQGDEARKS